ncbi:glycoside hydrolase family 1 protein [Mollicutes bacterium LVI A0039]|nr:glycoside hydrolase family 1 protein [Mollicutes bacterium LVI A0039]
MKYKFPEGFIWGAASSGPQSEGDQDKNNQNVWDAWFDEEPNRFYGNYSPKIACDTYNRYTEDVKLMKDLNFNSFRTSIQWTRLIDDLEQNSVSPVAVKYYRDYFEQMISSGIEPIINLYHFDMPAELMNKYGGFESMHVVELFVGYAKLCFELFGDIINKFTVFNEPIVPIEFGYFYDAHKPCKVDPKAGVQAAYNSIIAQALVIEAYKEGGYNGEIGTILNLTPAYPRSDHPADVEASEMCDLIFNRSFMDPSVLGKFNSKLSRELDKYNLLPTRIANDTTLVMQNTVDFVGLNYYVPRRVKAPLHEANKKGPWFPDWYFDSYTMPGNRVNPHRDNNEIYPEALYDIAKDVQNNYGNIKWYLAEIGISITAEEDLINNEGVVDDTFRTELLKEHLVCLHKAIEEGANCFGVHQWTFIDNWSWLNTHKRRYGFYFLNLETRERVLKMHALWFKQIITDNGFDE